MEFYQTQYKWKISAWSTLKKDSKEKKNEHYTKSDWFDKKEDCIDNFKEKKNQREYDLADSWESEEYILKRKAVPAKYRIGFKPQKYNHA
jgi:hypothetical protein